MSRRETDEHRKSDGVRSSFVGRTWEALAVLAFAATFVAACGGDSMSDRASPDEKAACARLEDIDHDRNRADERTLRIHLQAAVENAERSGNEALERVLRQVRDDFTAFKARDTTATESRTLIMRIGANLTLAEVECRERGVLLDPL